MSLSVSFVSLSDAAYFGRQCFCAGWRRCTLSHVAIVLAFFGLMTRARALDPNHELGQYVYQTWTAQNGLPANAITAIAQTSDGYLWLGSAKGLVRFDGVEFTRIDLSAGPQIRNTSVRALAADQHNRLWVGLQSSGFGEFDGRTYTPRSNPERGGTYLDVHGLAMTKAGQLLISSPAGWAQFNPTTGAYDPILETTEAAMFNGFALHEDAAGRLWFGTDSHGVFYAQNGKITALADPSLEAIIGTAIAHDTDDGIWIGTPRGLFGYGADLKRRQTLLPGDEVRALYLDRGGALWIGAESGLYRYFGGRLQTCQKEDGLATGRVLAIAGDREGTLWVGTRDGLSHLTDVKFPTVRATPTAAPEVLGVAASPRGGIWIAHASGISYYNGDYTAYTFADGLPASVYKRIYETRSGEVYTVSGARTLVVLADGKIVATHNAPEMVVGMAEDAHGFVISAGGHLYRASRGGLEPYVFAGAEPPMYWIVNLITARDGALWVASVNGAFRIADGRFRHWGTAQGVPEEGITTMGEDPDGVVWGGTKNGIVRLKGDKVRVIGRNEGLFSTDIYAIAADDRGYLWIDSGAGIYRVRRDEMNAVADGRASRVQSVLFNGPEAVRSTDKGNQEQVGARSVDGRIWFPSSRGVVVIDPAHVPMTSVAPLVHIESVEANGRPVTLSGVTVPPGRGELQVHFTGLSFLTPAKTTFRYRLRGYDTNWIEAGNRRFAAYNNLRPGKYVFEVTAANVDGVWAREPDSFAVTFAPHFYQTFWFYLAGVAALGGLIGVVFAARVRHLKAKARESEENRRRLESEVKLRTAELASSNEALQHQVEERKSAEQQLRQRTQALEKEIEERKRMQREVERVHRELVEVSRQAGMAEVATGVLHNVGNVLNSVNVSATLVLERMGKSRVPNVAKLGTMLQEHAGNLADFLTNDPRGRQVPTYLHALAENLQGEHAAMIDELQALRRNIGHINDIVAMQQNYAKIVAVSETVPVTDLVEDAIRINADSLERHGIAVVRDFQTTASITVERHKVLQILVNLIRNAKEACDASARTDKRLSLAIAQRDGHVRIIVGDNGVGIAPENLTRIFGHGFTTRKNGHGFGLHSSALAAKQLGGAISADSRGLGEGAAFTLEIPLLPPRDATEANS